MHTVDEDKYETLLILIVERKFHVPVAQRTRSQKSAVVQFFRLEKEGTLYSWT